MEVKILSITQPLVKTEDGSRNLTAEEFIVYAARVSNPSNQMNNETADKLIRYLIKNKHWSPLEQAHFGIEVKTSRAIAAQILRHWTLAVQEYSQRYAEVVDMEPVQIRKQGANRQGGEEVFNPIVSFKQKVYVVDSNNLVQNIKEVDIELSANIAVEMSIFNNVGLYKGLIKAEVAKECARMILPLTTSTTMILTGDLRTWFHYLQQRLDPHAQLEHREVAQKIETIFKENFPNIHKAATDFS